MDLDDGSRFGLPPIGLPQSNLGTPGSDTERRQMPGLATKGSVFAWSSENTTLMSYSLQAPTINATINLRKNTATGGSSVDVPTWAAGAVVLLRGSVGTMGVGITFHQFYVYSPFGADIAIVTHPHTGQVDKRQLIVPFYDEPIFSFMGINDLSSGLGTQSAEISLVGFIRNV